MKDKFDAIFKAFGAYIREHDSFDIVYSEKIGYVKLQAPHPDKETPEVMDTPETLLGALFLEVINDVTFSPDNPRHDNPALTEHEEMESRHRITAILGTMEDGDKARCLDFLDKYGSLNKDGQYEAIKRIKELAQLPTYQRFPAMDGQVFQQCPTEDELKKIQSARKKISTAEHELKLLEERGETDKEALDSYKRRISEAQREIGEIMLRYFIEQQ